MKKNKFTISINIFMGLIVLVTGGCTSLFNKNSESGQTPGQPVIEIAYCNVNSQAELCIASFGTENENKSLVNFITTDPSFPDFDLKITRDGVQSAYECRQVEDFPTSIYCVGEKISLGETIELQVLSRDDEHLIAKGVLNISFLALSTPITDSTTPIETAPQTLRATATQTPLIPSETPTVTVGRTQTTPSVTGTAVDSYPNSSYP